ncbi:uncharacterized protein LOC142979832 [Anticarsia gemmatalis]|uniref:uncharacterized protein LOC142979832 n=1 Tax=Anticarsia gemmatalis TaxID=129554 RepID=UPI003F768032
MENNILRQISMNYKHVIIDEIALDGLEGIGLDLLWRRVEKRLSGELTEKLKTRYWKFIANHKSLSFYALPQPLPYLEIQDRFTIIDETSGHLKEPEDYLDGPYEYKPIENEYGSSIYYSKRVPVKNVANMSYADVIAKYGERLVVVASIEERWHALAPHMPMTCLSQMMPINYCLLELIGKSRDNGQMSVGKSNLHKIIKESKALFYNRKHLQDLDLIYLRNITQVIKGKGIKCLLIRLKRFHKPSVLTMPKIGMLHNVVEYLLQCPDYSERSELIVKRGILTQKQNRRLQKTVNIFNFEDRLITLEDGSKSKKAKITQKRKYICLSSKSDESSGSEEEPEVPLACQYKVGIGLMRQAYEQFLDAGLQGLTQVQLSHLLGIEFYTARAICRIFRMRNIVREYLEDKGKQRTARFIAVVSTAKMDKKYEEQRSQFLEYLGKCKVPPSETGQNIETQPQPCTTSDEEIPLKRMKMEKASKSDQASKSQKPVRSENKDDDVINKDIELTQGNEITEIKVLDGFENSKSLGSFNKNPTLRQLRFATGVLKVLNEKLCISGYMTLSSLASKEVNEPPMDTKALKSFIQKLVTDGHIKMYKIKWPGLQRYSVLICAHHIKMSDPLVQAKYKEICIRAAISKKVSAKKAELQDNNPSLPKVRRSYPRYMKIQKLHEFVINLAYFDYVEPESHSLPPGYVCVVDLFPEATVEFLINNLCSLAAVDMYQLITDDQLTLKLKDTPSNVYKALMKSKIIQNSLRLNLKVLAMLGLVQLISHETAHTSNTGLSNSSSFLFYVNRKAKILNTSGPWPKPNPEVEELTFNFESHEDVVKYWSHVYNISISTEINVSNRSKKQLKPPLRSAEEVHLYDTGERFGDGLGPCGFDSCFFMEIPRLWQTFYARPHKRVMTQKKAKTPKFEVIKKSKAKPIKVPKKRVIEKPPVVPLKRRRPDGTVKWSEREDLIITICKAAITIMSPNSQPGSLIVRNTVAKDLLSFYDVKKTKGLCHSRASSLDTNIPFNHEKQCIINEMRRRRDLVHKYEGLLKKLRLKYSTNMSKFINKARLPLMELVWIIMQVMRSKSYTQRMPCVAVSLNDFYNHFSITTLTANKQCNMYKVPENSQLKEAIMVTVMQTLDNELDSDTAKKIYATFKEYPEGALRIAVEQLRKCSAIAAKEKLFNNQFRKLDLDDIVQSSYKISVFYRRKWLCRLNSDFIDKLSEILSTVECKNEIKGTAEMNCASCELEACDIMEIESTTVPLITDVNGTPIGPGEMSALTIDTKYSLKTGTMRWKKKNNAVNVKELYEHPQLDASLEYVANCGIVKISETPNSDVNEDDEVIMHLKQKGAQGATFMELQDLFGYESKVLVEKLQKLESDKIIKRVGFYENVIILLEYIKEWSIKIGDDYVICTPWLRLQSGMKIEVFLKWTSVVMNTVFEKPGVSLAYISDKCEFITYRALQDICVFLQTNECVKLNVVIHPTPDLFSDDDVEPQFLDFNPYYDPQNILAFPTKNCLTKYSCLVKMVMNKYSEKTCEISEDM